MPLAKLVVATFVPATPDPALRLSGIPSEELVRRISLGRLEVVSDDDVCGVFKLFDCWGVMTDKGALPEFRSLGVWRLLRLRPRRSDLAVRAVMKTTIPSTCSKVQTLWKRKNERNKVVALRAVLVIDMVSAPKCFVIAAEHEDPKKPMLENTTRTIHLADTDHSRLSIGRSI